MSPEQFSESEFNEGVGKDGKLKGHRPRGTIPYLPDRDASFSVLRNWVSNAIGLPPAVRLDTVTRAGRNDDDALTLYLSNGVKIRCPQQKRLQSPGPFSAFFASETDGLCRPPYLNRPEVADVFTALCALGSADETRNELDDLRERVETFIEMCEPLPGTLTPANRYTTLRALKTRGQYDKNAAKAVRGRKPVLVIDREWPAKFIRHIELLTYLREIHNQTLSDTFLQGRMRELECTYHKLQAHNLDRTHHAALAFYELSDDLADTE